ncbi:MAG: beta-lactamase family protein, partial [bacterium]|nr:beta-lactamase family protein [bacterium]
DTAPVPVSDGTLSTSIRGSQIETFRLKPQPAMAFPDTAWQERSPASQGVDPEALRGALNYLASAAGGDGTDETVVIRHGRLIWKGPLAGNKHTIYSCTKTFTSTVLGLLVEDGKLSLDDYARQYFPAIDDDYPLYADITIRQLASMTSGYRGESGERTEAHRWGEPSEYLKPSHPPANDPGAAFRYNDHGVHLLGAILTRLAGEPLEEFFRRRVAKPIGLRDWEWGEVGS